MLKSLFDQVTAGDWRVLRERCMPLTFTNPPLIELIAEVRWFPDGVRIAPNDASSLEVSTALLRQRGHDEFFMRFAGLASPKGYSQVERLVPPGFPFLPFQPVYRYRNESIPTGPRVYQLGVGIFSAHATPPYSSWQDFRPVVESGLDLLFGAFESEARPKQFAAVTLRYIDAFHEQFTQGKPIRQFLEENLGISVTLPSAITRHASHEASIRPHIDLFIPLKDSLQMTLKLADGQVLGKSAVIMDTSITQQPVESTASATMNAFEAAHAVIHSSFVELTRSFHGTMSPKEG